MAEWTIMLHDKVIKRFTLSEGSQVTIGRGSEADVVVDNTAISRQHTALELRDGVYFLSDLGSKNGTFVNGQKVDKAVPVSENDIVELGKFRLSVSLEDTPETSASSSSASPMDMDEETIFISSKKSGIKQPAPQAARGPVKKSGPRLTLISGNVNPAQLSLDGKSSIKIGKDPTCDMVLSGWLVAGAQCYIISRDEKHYIIPQGKWVATKINGIRIKGEHVLRKGDIIEIRDSKIRYE